MARGIINEGYFWYILLMVCNRKRPPHADFYLYQVVTEYGEANHLGKQWQQLAIVTGISNWIKSTLVRWL